MLERVFIVSFILRTIRPLFFALSELFVLYPLPGVDSTIGMIVRTLAMGHISDPVSNVDVASYVDETSVAVVHVVLPVSFIDGSVLPNKDSPAASLAVLVLPFVGGSVLVLVGSQDWKTRVHLGSICLQECSQLLILLFDIRVHFVHFLDKIALRGGRLMAVLFLCYLLCWLLVRSLHLKVVILIFLFPVTARLSHYWFIKFDKNDWLIGYFGYNLSQKEEDKSIKIGWVLLEILQNAILGMRMTIY